jgi:ATP-dependent Zn protease
MRIQDIVITALPYVILLGIWLFFMRKMMGRGGYGGIMEKTHRHIDRSFEYMAKTEEQLERIASALERIEAQRKTL